MALTIKQPNLGYFNFWTGETYHVFRWLLSSAADLDELVVDAFNTREEGQTGLVPSDPLSAARDALANDLEEEVEDLLEAWFRDYTANSGEWSLVAQWDDRVLGIPSTIASADHLFMPLLVESLGRVYWLSIAEAILRLAGRWPDNTLPVAHS